MTGAWDRGKRGKSAASEVHDEMVCVTMALAQGNHRTGLEEKGRVNVT